MYFQTDKSGKTWHKDIGYGVNIVSACGVTTEGTQWTRHAPTLQNVKIEGGKVCGGCGS